MTMAGRQQVIVLNQNIKRESGRKVQIGNANAAKAIADVIRTCLGPRSMLKMLMDPMGGVVMTNDGNSILREIMVEHPAAKTMMEIARTQDEEVGDGTTSVVILAGELMTVAMPFLEQQVHPTMIIAGYHRALDDLLVILKDDISMKVDVENRAEMLKIIRACIGTKTIKKWSDLACEIALDATRCVTLKDGDRSEIDIKRYAKVEKIPGGCFEDSRVLDGVMINKDVTHPKMRRCIENPRILLMDCSLEYKKGESQTNIEISKEQDFAEILRMEEDYIKKICDDIIELKPDLVISEKGVSDLAQHFLVKAGITAIRRVRKTDNNRIARACGAVIVNRTDELSESDIGTRCGLFEIRKFGEEYFSFIEKCKNPTACTILLRGASKDVLNEVERNLQDAMHVARNVMLDGRLLPGGGAVEMALSHALREKAKNVPNMIHHAYKAVATSLEIIPRTLIQNCGANIIRTITSLRAKHAISGNHVWGIDGDTGELVNQNDLGIWEPYSVKAQVYKTSIETAILLLKIDDIVSGTKKKEAGT